MIGSTHQDTEVSNFFNCYSQFKPYEEPEPEGLDDVEPAQVRADKKKNKGITYLPGEKLLIKLGKEKEKKKKVKPEKINLKRITESLSRVLNGV